MVVARLDDIKNRAEITKSLENLWAIFNSEKAQAAIGDWQPAMRLVVTGCKATHSSAQIARVLGKIYAERAAEVENGYCIPYLPMLEAFANRPNRIFAFAPGAVATTERRDEWLASIQLNGEVAGSLCSRLDGVPKAIIHSKIDLGVHNDLALALNRVAGQLIGAYQNYEDHSQAVTYYSRQLGQKQEEIKQLGQNIQGLKENEQADRSREIARWTEAYQRIRQQCERLQQEFAGERDKCHQLGVELSAAKTKLQQEPKTIEKIYHVGKGRRRYGFFGPRSGGGECRVSLPNPCYLSLSNDYQLLKYRIQLLESRMERLGRERDIVLQDQEGMLGFIEKLRSEPETSLLATTCMANIQRQLDD